MEKYKERLKEEEGFHTNVELKRKVAVKKSHDVMRDLLDEKNNFVNYLQETMEDEPDLSKINDLMTQVSSVTQDLISIEIRRLEEIEKLAEYLRIGSKIIKKPF